MCTVTLNINESQARKFNPSLKDMEAITRWAQKIIDDILADNHISHSKEEPLKPYTMEEIDAMLDEAEAAFEAGDYLTQDEVFHRREPKRQAAQTK